MSDRHLEELRQQSEELERRLAAFHTMVKSQPPRATEPDLPTRNRLADLFELFGYFISLQ
jgi:hypothetical protein